MGQVSQISYPTVRYDLDVVWPSNDLRYIAGAGFVMTGFRNGIGAANVFDAIAGAGGNGRAVDANLGFFSYLASSGAGAVTLCTAQVLKAYTPLVLPAGLPADYRSPSWQRIYRFQLVMWHDLAAPAAVWTYAGWAPEAGVQAGSPAPGSTQPFMGIRANAGLWEWVSSLNGGAIADTVALGIPTNQHTVFDFVILPPTRTAAARMELWTNGTRRLQRAWGPGTVLSGYAIPAGATHFVPIFGCADAAVATRIAVQSARFMSGQYEVDGVEI